MALTKEQSKVLMNYLNNAIKSNDTGTLTKVLNAIVGDASTRAQYDELTSDFNPLKGLEMYSYMPMKKWLPDETPQQVLERTNNMINLQNILGDIMTGIGGTLNIKNQAQAQALQNMANTRGNRERELYGANASDYAAAVGAPAASGLGNVEQLLSGIFANRIYGNAALKRQAEMQAVLDAYNRNVGGTGLYFDARRKTAEQMPGMSNIK